MNIFFWQLFNLTWTMNIFFWRISPSLLGRAHYKDWTTIFRPTFLVGRKASKKDVHFVHARVQWTSFFNAFLPHVDNEHLFLTHFALPFRGGHIIHIGQHFLRPTFLVGRFLSKKDVHWTDVMSKMNIFSCKPTWTMNIFFWRILPSPFRGRAHYTYWTTLIP